MPSLSYKIKFHLRKHFRKTKWYLFKYPRILFDYYYLRYYGVETKKGFVHLMGLPIISKTKGSRIILEKGCVLVSKSKFNVAGINHPVILATLSSEAVIKIGNSGISGSAICAAKKITIGNHCALGVNSKIYDTDFHPLDAYKRRTQSSIFDANCNEVIISDDVWLGANSVILKGVCIGKGAVVGACSLVKCSIPDYTLYAGNPAIKIKDLKDNLIPLS